MLAVLIQKTYSTRIKPLLHQSFIRFISSSFSHSNKVIPSFPGFGPPMKFQTATHKTVGIRGLVDGR